MTTNIQNKHLEHLEDRLLDTGTVGAEESIAFLESVHEMLKGSASAPVNITTKFDGAPSFVAGMDPERNRFFVATKHGAFAKDMQLCFGETDCEIVYAGKGTLVDTMKLLWRELSPLGITGVMQGDVMFTPTIKKNQTIDGKDYITFKPNTIVYAIPVDDPLAEKIGPAKLGVVFHTKYTGSGAVNQMSASFNVDVSNIKSSKTVWVEDARYKDLTGNVTLTSQESATITRKLTSAKSSVTRLSSFIEGISKEKKALSLGVLFKRFVNKLIRENALSKNDINMKFLPYVIDQIDAKASTVSTIAAKTRYEDMKKEVTEYLRTHNTELMALVSLYDDLIDIKNLFVSKLERGSLLTLFVETEAGFQVTGPEGFVAIDRASGNVVKLVNRLEFSRLNFNSVKDWKKPVEAVDNTRPQVSKTMVMTFGRFNPPTSGHERVIKFVKSTADSNRADHAIVISHTQDAKSNPLEVGEKLAFMKQMFPNINIIASSPLIPTFFKFFTKFYEEGYTDIIMVVGSDRADSFRRMIAGVREKESLQGERTLLSITVLSAGERDPDAEGVTGISGTKMREFAKKNDFISFRAGLPDSTPKEVGKELFVALKRRLNIRK